MPPREQHPQPTSPTRLELFLDAGIADLCRMANVPCGPSPKPLYRQHSYPELAPALQPQIAALALYLRLVSYGLTPEHAILFPRRARLRRLLNDAYRTATSSQESSRVPVGVRLQGHAHALGRFARRHISENSFDRGRLRDFGVKNIRRSLAILTEKLAIVFAREIAKSPAKAPAELLGASLIASATCPGVAQAIVAKGHTVQAVMRLGVRTGLSGASPTTTSTKKSAATAGLRKFLKRADRILGR